MSVLVTGGNGLVGSRLVARLAERHEVIATGRGAPRHALPARWVELDLRAPWALRELIRREKPEAVFHAAAMTEVDPCETDTDGAWLLNVTAVEQAALGCKDTGAKLVALSTDYVFDGDRGPYSEDDEPRPRGVYARTKRAGEDAALLCAPGALVCRVAAVFSGFPGVRRNFAMQVAEALLAGKPVKAFHDQVVSPTLADDAAALILATWQRGASGIYHCCGADAVTRVDFCTRLARKLGADEKLVVPTALAELKLPAPRPMRAGLRVDKVRGLGLQPLSLDAALDRFLAERAA